MKRARQDSTSSEAPSLLFGDAFMTPESETTQADRAGSEDVGSKVKKRKTSKKSEPKDKSQLLGDPSEALFAAQPLVPERVVDEPSNASEESTSIAAQGADVEVDDQCEADSTVNSQELESTPNTFVETDRRTEEFTVEEAVKTMVDGPSEKDDVTNVAMSSSESSLPSKSENSEVASSVSQASTSTPSEFQRREKKPSAYQVVARRYRPQAFDELIGQETVARALSNAIETDRVGHAYLFTGARGVGKTSCARIFAKALNCVEGPTTHPCLKCDSCVGIATGDDVDVLEIDGASNRGVDEIRQLRQNATIAPSRSLYKIYIIDEVHMLTREAFNALLKTLEEPPARVKFIFCTTEPNKIPITILSRCQRFDFSSINGGSIASRLAQIAKQEGAESEEGVFDILARRANGSMRDAQSLLEQLLSFAPTYISKETVHNMLGSVDDRKIFDLLDATAQGNAARVFETLGIAATQGVDFGTLIEQMLGVYRDLMVVASGCGEKELLYSPVARLTELQKIAQAFGIRRILASLQILDQTAQRMRYSAQARVLAEIALVRLCRLDAFQSLESLIAQLQSGAIPNAQVALPISSSSPSQQEDDEQKKNLANVNPVPAPHPAIGASAPTQSDNSATIMTRSTSQLQAAWHEATNRGVVLPNHATTAAEVRIEPPNSFVVVFPGDRSTERDYCEMERTTIQERLGELLGAKLHLRLIVDPNLKSPQKPPTSNVGARGEPRAARVNLRALYTQVAESEIALQIKEVFDADLVEVKPPAINKSQSPTT